MKPKIKYDVNVLGMKNKKSMMKNFFFTKKPCSIMKINDCLTLRTINVQL